MDIQERDFNIGHKHLDVFHVRSLKELIFEPEFSKGSILLAKWAQ
jgi:hypothetical protein